jgi:hypothetical protein
MAFLYFLEIANFIVLYPLIFHANTGIILLLAREVY